MIHREHKGPERGRTRKAAGFSLIELMISVALLGGVLASVAMISQSNERAYRTGAVQADLEQRAAATIALLVAELGVAGLETLDPPLPEGLAVDALQYLQATGMSGSTVLWTPLRRLAFEFEPAELNDGIDNDGNGLIDEGHLVLTEDLGGPNERRRVLTRWVRELAQGEEPNGVDDNGNGLVDERGFSLERVGETLIVRLTLEKSNAEGMPMVRTATTSIRLRN